MFPHQPTWSNSRINLLQRCPRAFVLRYGLAQLSKHHERGQILSIAFQIQTPWILLHQTIREVILDYLEDYMNGTVWSNGLIRSRFKMDYEKAMRNRNELIDRIHAHNHLASFQKKQPERHLIDMGVDACVKIIQHQYLQNLLAHGSIERIEPTTPTRHGNFKLYSAPDFIHRGRGTSLVKLNLYGLASRNNRERQAALMRLYGDQNSTVVLFSLKGRKWFVDRITSTNNQIKQSINLVENDMKQMESVLTRVGRNNDLSLIPLADSYRSCMNCNVRFLCPSQHGLEQAKAEQRVLMCQSFDTVGRFL